MEPGLNCRRALLFSLPCISLCSTNCAECTIDLAEKSRGDEGYITLCSGSLPSQSPFSLSLKKAVDLPNCTGTSPIYEDPVSRPVVDC